MRLSLKEMSVTVANALRVKRFIQMKGERNKSDKKDAKMIYHYGMEQELELWKAPSETQVCSRQIMTTMALLTKQQTMLMNRIHSVEHQPIQDKYQLRSLKRLLRELAKEIAGLEQALESIITDWVPGQYKNLQTIPGIGKKASMTLIVRTDAFTRVESYRHLISLAGMAPKEFSSGSSIRARTRICKMGGADLRRCMYLSSMSAIRYNPMCKAMFERLKGKGKNGRSAMIAVGNKLLKQSFAIAKSGVPFNPNYQNELITI
jgi:transposase